MRSFWSDPYLWIHLSGIAALPILLEISFLGLSLGEPVLPVGLEFLVIAAIGILPILWMQWQRPFYIFSLLFIALKPGQLTPEQRKLLQLFKRQGNRVLAVVGALFLVWVLWQLYQWKPIAPELPIALPASRILGIGIAAIAFLASNLFLQVPLSVFTVLLAGDTTFSAIAPYPEEQIAGDFTLLGWRVNQILPALLQETLRGTSLSTEIDAKPLPLSRTTLSDQVAVKANSSEIEQETGNPIDDDPWAD